jgi:hypothetical protein
VTQTVTAPAHVAPPGRMARFRDSALEASRGTPGRMRLVSAGLVILCLLLGLAGEQAFRATRGSLDRAAANAAQVVRLGELQISLVSADADATNAFLVGGLEPAEQRAHYDAAAQRAAELVAQAARAQPADVQALAALNTAIQAYTGQIELARANNRQGLPVGAQYLRNASSGLRTDALPLLESLTAANQQRVQTEFTHARQAWIALTGVGLLALAGLVLASIWLARRTHRYLNLPLVGAGVVILVTLIAGAVGLLTLGGSVGSVRDGPYTDVQALSEARVEAFDAKANESLTLISRGSGAAFEKAWQVSSATTTRLVEPYPVIKTQWAEYVSAHRAIRALDDSGRWDRAVAAATSRADNSANAKFDAFDDSTSRALTQSAAATDRDLQSAGAWLSLATWLAVAAGLLASLLSWWGLAQRLEEYR